MRRVISLRKCLFILPVLLAAIPGAIALPSAASASAPVHATVAAPVQQQAKPNPTAKQRCGGRLTFGEIVSCPSIVDDQKHTYTVTTTKNDDTLYVTNTRGTGEFTSGQITGADGTNICYVSVDTSQCRVGKAGRYTITLSLYFGGTGNYTLAVDSLKTPSSCTQLTSAFFSFANGGRTATLPTGSAGHCFRFDQPVGSVLQMAAPGGGDVQGQILDAQLQPVCQIRYATQCTLTTAGPYKFFLFEYYGTQATYTLRMPRLSQSVGCPVLKPATFGNPGANTNTGTVRAQEDFACHKVRTTAAGPILVRIFDGQSLSWGVYDNAGSRICNDYEHSRACQLPAAGDYTLLVTNRDWNEITYQVAVTALSRNTGCAPATGTAWTVPTISVPQASPVGTQCQPFSGQAGDRILTYAAPTVYNEVRAWIVDSAGNALCQEYSEQAGCVLPATGTYRVVSHLGRWDAEHTDAPYELQVRRLNDPVGCPTVTPGNYGEAPALGGIRCRVLDVPAAGTYQVKLRSAANDTNYATAYDADGNTACNAYDSCQFAAPGRYTLVLSGAPSSIVDNDFTYTTTFLKAAPSGCAAAPDDATAVSGEFRGVGQVDCLQLSSPAGAKVVRLVPEAARGAARPDLRVVDANGEYMCDANSLYQYSCELTGTAPFFVVVDNTEGEPTGSYQLGFARVSPPPSCPTLGPDAAGVTATSAGNLFGFCFSVPADAHAARETFRYQRTSGSGNAVLSVFNDEGIRYCYTLSPSADRTLTCTLPEGPLTVVLETDAEAATWQVTHRDAGTP